VVFIVNKLASISYYDIKLFEKFEKFESSETMKVEERMA